MENQVNEATASQEQGFVPMQISDPDYDAIQEVENHYKEICEVLNNLFDATEEVVFLGKELSIDDFFSFIESKDAERWCYRKHIKAAEFSFGDMDHERVIDLKLFQIEGFERVTELYKKFKNLKSKQVKFDYSIKKLYVAELNQFSIETGTEEISDFITSVENRFSMFTETPEQNKVLDILTTIVDNYNKLAEMGILRMKNGILELDIIGSFFTIDKHFREVAPFKVHPYVFKRHNRLAQFRVKKEITV